MLNEQNQNTEQKTDVENDEEKTVELRNQEYYLTNVEHYDNPKPDTLSIYLKSKDTCIQPLRWSTEDKFYPINIHSIPERISGIARIAHLDKNYLNYNY